MCNKPSLREDYFSRFITRPTLFPSPERPTNFILDLKTDTLIKLMKEIYNELSTRSDIEDIDVTITKKETF